MLAGSDGEDEDDSDEWALSDSRVLGPLPRNHSHVVAVQRASCSPEYSSTPPPRIPPGTLSAPKYSSTPPPLRQRGTLT